jgi:hypothetical protein
MVRAIAWRTLVDFGRIWYCQASGQGAGMLKIRYVPCEHCGSPRDPNLGLACPLCLSRRYPIIGYSYAHEARTLMLMGVIVAVLGLLAVLIGAGVLVMLETRLSAL